MAITRDSDTLNPLANPFANPFVPAEPIDSVAEQLMIFLLPFFLDGTGGDHTLARIAMLQMIASYQVVTPRELLLASRIIAFGFAAMDSLSRSMADPAMPDAMRLRHRASANALNRGAEQCQKTLDALLQQRADQEAASSPDEAVGWMSADTGTQKQAADPMLADPPRQALSGSQPPMSPRQPRNDLPDAFPAQHPAATAWQERQDGSACQPNPAMLEALLGAPGRIATEAHPLRPTPKR